MTKGLKLFFIIFGLIIFIGIGWYVFSITKPVQSEVTNKSEKVVIVPTDLFANSIIENLKSLRVNGTLPILVSPKEKGRGNPYANY